MTKKGRRTFFLLFFLDQLINEDARARRVPISWGISRICVPLGGGAVFGCKAGVGLWLWFWLGGRGV